MERQSSLLASINAVGEHRVKRTGGVKQAVSAASNFAFFRISSYLSPTEGFQSIHC